MQASWDGEIEQISGWQRERAIMIIVRPVGGLKVLPQEYAGLRVHRGLWTEVNLFLGPQARTSESGDHFRPILLNLLEYEISFRLLEYKGEEVSRAATPPLRLRWRFLTLKVANLLIASKESVHTVQVR